MKAVILCNTDTERTSALLPVTERIPLCGFEIAGVTPLYRAVQNACSNGMSDIYVIGDYLTRRIEEYLLTDRFKNMKPKFCQYESNFANKLNEIANGEDILAGPVWKQGWMHTLPNRWIWIYWKKTSGFICRQKHNKRRREQKNGYF